MKVEVKTMQNNIYEFGGIANVLIRCKTAQTICGKSYKPHEPYTLLKDVYVNYTYEQKDSMSAAKKPVLSANSGRPTQITISKVPLTQKIANLVLTADDNSFYNKTRMETVNCLTNGELFVNYKPIDGTLYVYDQEMNLIEGVVLQEQTIHGAFVADSKYMVFYEELAAGDKYTFEIPYYPYFEIDVFIKGNTNKISNDVFMHFDAVSLVAVPNFNIYEGGILNTPLVFNVIYTHQEEPFVVFE